MVIFRVNDTVNLCASIVDFCGTSNFLINHDINVSVSPNPCNINIAIPNGCLSLAGRILEFQWTNASGSVEKHTCNVLTNLKTLGTAVTDSQGVASLQYTITQNDLDLFTASGYLFDLRVCINDVDIQPTVLSKTRNEYQPDSITIQSPFQLTHYAKIPLVFLTDEVADLLESKISEISNRFVTDVGTLPAPWIYLYTTFERSTGSLVVYLHNTSVPLSVSKYDIVTDIQGVLDWLWNNLFGLFSLFVAVLGAAAMVIGGVTLLPLIAAILGVVGTGVWIYDAIIQKEELKKEVDNLNVLKQQGEIPNNIKQFVIDCWNSSDSSQEACLKCRFDMYKNLHIEWIKGYILKYPQQIAMADELNNEINTFIITADNIINQFSAQPYSVSVCDTYYILIDSEVSSSVTRTIAIVNSYITGGVWTIKCSDYVTTGLCKQAGCMWSYDKCVSKQSCLIPNIDGTCLFSTENAIAGIPAVLGIGFAGMLIINFGPSFINMLRQGVDEINKPK